MITENDNRLDIDSLLKDSTSEADELVSDILNKNFDSASNHLKTRLAAKSLNALDTMKKNLASSLYSST